MVHTDVKHGNDYLVLRRVETRLRREARNRGLQGDPLADCPAVADDAAGQLGAVQLWLALPAPWRRHPAAWDMSRAAVYGRAVA
jgi:hypothetical protein